MAYKRVLVAPFFLRGQLMHHFGKTSGTKPYRLCTSWPMRGRESACYPPFTHACMCSSTFPLTPLPPAYMNARAHAHNTHAYKRSHEFMHRNLVFACALFSRATAPAT